MVIASILSRYSWARAPGPANFGRDSWAGKDSTPVETKLFETAIGLMSSSRLLEVKGWPRSGDLYL
jgi:hypothetical protein